MCIGELTQRFSHLRMPLFPAFAATEGRLRTATHEASASLGQAKRHRLAAPTKDGFRHQGLAATILQRHLGLKGAPCGAGHVGCREAEIGNLGWTGQREAVQRGMVHRHDRTSRRELEFAFLADHLSMPTLTEYEFFRKSPNDEMRAFCHGIASFFLPTRLTRSTLVVHHAPLHLAKRSGHTTS